MCLHPGELIELVGKWTLNEDVLAIEHGDIPASYVSLPAGNILKKLNERCKIYRIHVWYKYVPIHLPYKSTIHIGIWVFPNLMGTPKCMVIIMENPMNKWNKWMIWGENPPF